MTRTVLQALTPGKPIVSPPGGTKGTGFLVLLVAVLLAASWLFFKAFIVASAVAVNVPVDDCWVRGWAAFTPKGGCAASPPAWASA